MGFVIPWIIGIPLGWYMAKQRKKLIVTANRLRETQDQLKQANKSLTYKANFDGMTGLPNREFFFDQLKGLEAARQDSVLMIIDVDHFKQINDSFGHPVGDRALTLLASVFRKILRRNDIVGRIGGEEFGILLPDASEAEGQIIGEMIRYEIENTVFEPHEGVRHVITVSIGISSALSPHDSSKLMRNADKALFEAKRTGRNKVMLFEPGMRSTPRPHYDKAQDLQRTFDMSDISKAHN